MFARKRIRSVGIVLILAMLLAAMPVWAEDPMPTDKYDLLIPPPITIQDPMPTDKYDLLKLPIEAPSTLPETGLSRAQQADAARWQGLATVYRSSALAMLPTTGLTPAQQADAARWRGWAEFYGRE